MIKGLQKWLKGVEVSEVSLVLPFVQITLKPSEDTSGQHISSRRTGSSQLNAQRHEVKLNVIPDSANSLISDGLIKPGYLYNTPTKIFPVHTGKDYSNQQAPVTRTFKDYPLFEGKWRALSGSIEFHTDELIWIVGRYTNISRRVLHRVPLSLRVLPFLKGLQGVVGSLGTGFIWIDDVGNDYVMDYINPGDTVAVFCFCRAPTKLDGRVVFTNYLPKEPRDLSSLQPEPPNITDQRYYVECVINHQYDGRKLMKDIDPDFQGESSGPLPPDSTNFVNVIPPLSAPPPSSKPK